MDFNEQENDFSEILFHYFFSKLKKSLVKYKKRQTNHTKHMIDLAEPGNF